MKAAHLKVLPSPRHDTPEASPDESAHEPAPVSVEHALPHGRKVVITAGSPTPIEVVAPDGQVEVAIVLTPQGPVVQLKGARLELSAPESVTVRTAKLALEAEQEVKIKSPGHVVVEGKQVDLAASGDVKVKGGRIFLN